MLYLAADLFRICIKFLFVSIELLFAGFLCLFHCRAYFLCQCIDTLPNRFMTCHFLAFLCLCVKRTESCKYCQ